MIAMNAEVAEDHITIGMNWWESFLLLDLKFIFVFSYERSSKRFQAEDSAGNYEDSPDTNGRWGANRRGANGRGRGRGRNGGGGGAGRHFEDRHSNRFENVAPAPAMEVPESNGGRKWNEKQPCKFYRDGFCREVSLDQFDRSLDLLIALWARFGWLDLLMDFFCSKSETFFRARTAPIVMMLSKWKRRRNQIYADIIWMDFVEMAKSKFLLFV